MLKIRNAEFSDLGRILEIYRYAQDFMIKTGNPTQWGDDKPKTEWLIEDIRECVDVLGRYINRSVTKGQYIALVSLAFNLGPYNVVTRCPKLMRALNSGDIEGAAKEFLDCDRANGRRVPGLTRRRIAEAELFLGEPC